MIARTTTTLDSASTDTFLISLQRVNDGWIAKSIYGLRFGNGDTIESAITDLMDALRELASLDGQIAPGLMEEVRWAQEIVR